MKEKQTITRAAWLRIWGFSLITAALLLLVGTASSPLFPYNVWDDANCFLTVGRSLFHGKVLYRDIFEQKGLYLYVIYGIGGLLSKSSFLGVYVLEVISFTLFLAYAARLVCRYVRERFAYAVLPIFSVIILATPCFEKGGSAEEFCLPFFMIVLCHAVEIFDQRGSGFTVWKMFTGGFLIAIVFFIKYNLAFLMIGIYLGYLLFFIGQRQWLRLGMCALFTVLGMAAGALPAILYFVMNDAMGDLWFGYFYCNLFLYHPQDELMNKVRSTVDHMVWYAKANYLTAALSLLGIFGFLRRHKDAMRLGRMFLPASLILCIVGCVAVPSVVGVYYYLPLTVFAIFGFIEMCQLSEHTTCLGFRPWRLAVLMAACTAMVFYGSNAHFLFSIPKDELPQVKFAKIIKEKENPTVLNYGCLDTGIYTLAGVEPPTKFFCRLNLESYKEMNEVPFKMIQNKEVDFIVILNGSPDPDQIDGYKQVAQAEMYLTGAGQYHLYQKIDKRP